MAGKLPRKLFVILHCAGIIIEINMCAAVFINMRAHDIHP